MNHRDHHRTNPYVPLGLGLALVLAVAALWPLTAPAGSARTETLHGIVERVPDTPARIGPWSIGGRTVIVDEATRLDERPVATDGYWTQIVTGVVVRAPGWTTDTADLVGFRPATAKEVATIAPGRYVKATLEPTDTGAVRAVEIELHDRSGPRPAR